MTGRDTNVRISPKAHTKLRRLAYERDTSIKKIIDDLVENVEIA